MKRLYSKISIGDFEFTYVTEVEISSSWKDLTDKCSITLPKQLTKDGESIINPDNGTAIFKKGDAVKVELGYFPDSEVYFTGYVSKVIPSSPIVIECEDEMFLLKQETKTRSWKDVDLETIVSDIAPNVKSEVVDAKLGDLRLKGVTPAQVLAEIKKVYKLDAYFRDETLYVGLRYQAELQTEHDIVIEYDVPLGDHSLEWVNESDVKIKVKAISMMPDNTKVEIEVGDPDGEQRTAYFYNIAAKDLKTLAEAEIPKFRFTGFRGGFVTFGNKRIYHGDIINLESYKYPDLKGAYVVDKVNTSFGQGGFRQSVELGLKAK